MPRYEEEENVALLPTSRDDLLSCVLCVGSTGSGKSATVAKFTRLPIKSNAGVNRVTTRCAMYRRPGDPLAWIDTVGWDDVHFDDEDTFQDILRFIDNNYLQQLLAVVWTVHPNVRQAGMLTKQAKLIDMFAPGRVWNNVIIICKQSMSPEDDGRGALAAALELNPHANIQLVGYRFIDDETFSAKQKAKLKEDPSAREAFNVKTDDEVRLELCAALDNIDGPLQVVFRTSRCADCGERGDKRLLSKYCHMAPIWIHTGILEPTHPGNPEAYHTSSACQWKHKGRLIKLPGPLGGSRYACCGKRPEKSQGCRGRWPCCKMQPKEAGCRTRLNCCQVDLANADRNFRDGCQNRFACCRGKPGDKGCTQVCKKCDQPWGTPSNECFKKKHTIEEAGSRDTTLTREEADVIMRPVEKEDTRLQKNHELPPIIIYHFF